MSAPIDDLLYGGDDSGDEDDMNGTTHALSLCACVLQSPASVRANVSL